MADKWSQKDPSDVRDYRFDWGDFLPTGETITDYVITVPDELTLVDDTNTDTSVTVRLGGGTLGDQFEVGCLITTTTGQIFDLTAVLKIADRIVKGQGVR